MTNDEIKFIRDLDPEGVDGTIQSLLMGNLTKSGVDLENYPYVKVLVHLVKTLKQEKEALVKDNLSLSSQVQALSSQRGALEEMLATINAVENVHKPKVY